MSRHRDVRTMKYSDEYDGYDDVYGHSVEDDYCVSPSTEQFMFDRSKQQNIASFFTEPDIKEDSEEDEEACGTLKKPELSEMDTAKLVSCIEVIRNVVGDSIPEAELTEKILKVDFNAEVALDEILKGTPKKDEFPAAMAKDRLDSQTGSSGSHSRFTNPFGHQPKIPLIPNKNNSFKNSLSGRNSESPLKFGATNSTGVKPEFKFSSLSALIADHSQKNLDSSVRVHEKTFGTLADLTQNHLLNSGNSPGRISNFVIPKLSLTSNKSVPSIPSFNIKTGGEKERSVAESVQTLEKDLVNMQISPESDVQREKVNNSECDLDDNLPEQTENEFLIDLTTALRQTKMLSVTEKKKPEQLNKYDLKDIYIMTAEPLPSSMIVENMLKQCEINLSRLQSTKLSHGSQSVSLFGKILCRRWRPRKPYVKSHVEAPHKLTIFDFTSPSPDNLFMSKLKRK